VRREFFARIFSKIFSEENCGANSAVRARAELSRISRCASRGIFTSVEKQRFFRTNSHVLNRAHPRRAARRCGEACGAARRAHREQIAQHPAFAVEIAKICLQILQKCLL
jgi:hypothetical protein